MTIDEAIKHADEVSESSCDECQKEHRQLSEWLVELKELRSKYMYLAADFDNYRKRTLKSESYAHDKAYEYVITNFLSLYDDMERIYNTIHDEDSDEIETEANPLISGFELIFENFEKTLNNLGCEKVECSYGDKFNVDTMEAISVREIQDDEGYDPDDVVEIYHSGWKFNGKVIRHAKVVIGKEKEQVL